MPTVIEWVLHLEGKIHAQRLYGRPWEARYRNQYVLPFLLAEYREVYGGAVDMVTPQLLPPQTGTAAIGIDALVERLTVLGAGAIEEDASEEVRRVQQAWEDSDLDVMHREAHREAFIKGRSYAQVLATKDGRAVIGIESPDQMAVHREQVPPYDVDAALKIWVDEWTNKPMARLELPGKRYHLAYAEQGEMDPENSGKFSHWTVTEVEDTKLPRVAVAEFTQRPRLLADPVSEIEPIYTLVDLADLVEGLMVFAGHFGAVPIRYATGLPVARDPKDPTGQTPLKGPDGKAVLGFKPRSDHIWFSTDKDTEFGQLTPAGLDSFVAWAEHVKALVRAKTTVPGPYYGIDPKSHMSAELLKVDEAPMVRRVLAMGRDGSFGQAWRRVFEMILMIEAPSSRVRVRPRWADPETRVEAQATDSFTKLVSSGIGVRVAAEKVLGWDRELVERGVTEAARAQVDLAGMLDDLGVADTMEPDELAKRANAAGILIRSGFEPADALRTAGLDPIEHLGLLPVTVQAA
jgi:hypothetical protein